MNVIVDLNNEWPGCKVAWNHERHNNDAMVTTCRPSSEPDVKSMN